MDKNYKFKQNKNNKKSKMKTNKPGYYNYQPIFSFFKYIQSDKYFSQEHSNEARNSLYNFFQNIKSFSEITWGEMKEHPNVYHFHSFDENIREYLGSTGTVNKNLKIIQKMI